MNSISILTKHFPGLSQQQVSSFETFKNLFVDWNVKINLVSRKDIDNFYISHVLHSLVIAKFISFVPKTIVMDIGTGGGFPGIPLAIYFPEVNFILVDSVGKKINAVKAMAEALELKNVVALNSRAEQLTRQVDFIVSRATAPLSDLVNWTKGKIKKESINQLPNGIICLKGGDVKEELRPFIRKVHTEDVKSYISEPSFNEKKIIYLPFQ